jgi:hypothetical protein
MAGAKRLTDGGWNPQREASAPSMFIWFLHNTFGPRNCGITPLGTNRYKPFEYWLLSRPQSWERCNMWFDTLGSPLKIVHGALDALFGNQLQWTHFEVCLHRHYLGK